MLPDVFDKDVVLANYCRTRFAGWAEEAFGEGATRTWSGLLTDSKDTLPLVGEVPGKKGMYLSAGFHGHGQVSPCGWKCVRARANHLAAPVVADLYHRKGTCGNPASYRPMARKLAQVLMLTGERLEKGRHVEQVMDVYTEMDKEEESDVKVQVEGMSRH